jgi:hypothetical protein
MQTQRIVEGDKRLNGLANLRHWGQQRKCTRCNRPANKDRPFCSWHGKYEIKRPSPERLAARALVSMEQEGLIPADLAMLPIWQQLQQLTMGPRAANQYRLLLLWHRKDNETLAWAQAWRLALQAIERGTARR